MSRDTSQSWLLLYVSGGNVRQSISTTNDTEVEGFYAVLFNFIVTGRKRVRCCVEAYRLPYMFKAFYEERKKK